MSVDIKLLQEIEKNPCLYNMYLPEYNRKEELEGAWIDVSQECNLSISEAKDKWKNIRSSFVRSLKLLENKKTKKSYYLSPYLQFVVPFLKVGTEKHDDSNYPSLLNEKLDTVDLDPDEDCQINDELPVTIKIEPEFNVDNDMLFDTDYGYEPHETTSEETVKSQRIYLMKRKLDEQDKCNKISKTRQDSSVSTSKTENVAMRYFMMSLLPEFDTMTEDQIRSFKVKTLTTIDEIKNGSFKPQHSNSDHLQKRLINLLLKNLEKNS